MDRVRVARVLAVVGTSLLLGACAAAPPRADGGAAPAAGDARPAGEARARASVFRGLSALWAAIVATVRPVEASESDGLVVTVARIGDTTESLAARFLGDPAKAWMIEDYNGVRRLTPGQVVVIPKRPWNPSGVDPTGYQVVPILVYHNIAPQAKGRLVIGVTTFEEQMRHLKAQGYRVVSLQDFYEFVSLKRQLPRRAVVLTFDDGYRSFREYAYPVLKELGFTATLFVYTDYVGATRNALTWEELRGLSLEGFDVQAHSKTHSDLRRRFDETAEEYARRMEAELAQPLLLISRNLGRSSRMLAYPFGYHDDELVQKLGEHGYLAAFDVRRQGNASFVHPLRAHRTQVYSDMSLEEFAKTLTTFQPEPVR